MHSKKLTKNWQVIALLEEKIFEAEMDCASVLLLYGAKIGIIIGVKVCEELVALWPKGGPLADSKPTPVANVQAQTLRVLDTLNSIN